MVTAADLIIAGLARSAVARVDLLVTSQGELLRELQHALNRAYIRASQVRPAHFIGRSAVAFVTTPVRGWPMPAGAVRPIVGYLRSDTLPAPATDPIVGWVAGSEIVIVHENDVDSNPYQPCIVDRGRMLGITSLTGNPNGGSIDLEYARSAPVLSTLATSLETAWNEEHNILLELAIAIYAARKDGRADDAAGFELELRTAEQVFEAYVEGTSLREQARHARPLRRETQPAREQ